MAAAGKLSVIDVHTKRRVCGAKVINGETIFDKDDLRWVWILDARIEPYSELSLDEVIHRAEHVRKEYVLIAEPEPDDEGDE